MWWYFNDNHERPYEAIRQGRRRIASIELVTGEMLAGTVPPQALRAVQQLLREHQAEALEAFERALGHELPGGLDGHETGATGA